MEGDGFKINRAATRDGGCGGRIGGRHDGGVRVQQLHQPFGGPGGAQQVAIDLAQHAGGTGQDDHVQHRLAQVASADVAAHHGLGALVQAPQQRGRGGDDDESHQHRARLGAAHGGVEGGVGGGVETCRLAAFGGVALHHRNGVQHLGGNRAGVGHPVLAVARQFAHPPAKPDAGQHDQHQHAQHLEHHIGVGIHQHGQRAHAHHRVAQAHAQRRAHHGLHQRGVGGEAAQHLARLRGLEERRALVQHMAVHRVAQVGGDAFAEPAHGVEAGGGKQPEAHRHREQFDEMRFQCHDLRTPVGQAEAVVHQAFEGDREHQRGRRRQHQEQPGQCDAAPVRPQERAEAGE